MDMFKGNDTELKALLNNNLDVLLDDVKTDDPEVLNAIQVLKKHHQDELNKQILDGWQFRDKNTHNNKPYLYICVRGIVKGTTLESNYINLENSDVRLLSQYKRGTAKIIADKIKSLFVK